MAIASTSRLPPRSDSLSQKMNLYTVGSRLGIDHLKCIGILNSSTDQPRSIEPQDPMEPGEVLILCCYQFLRRHVPNEYKWLTWLLKSLRPLCEQESDKLEEHRRNFLTSKDIAAIAGSILVVANERYVTFTGSNVYYDTQEVATCLFPDRPPVTVNQLMLPSIYMEVLNSKHEADQPNPESVS